MTRPATLAAVVLSALSLGCCGRVVIHTGPRATATEEIVVEPGAATALSIDTSAGNIEVGPCLPERGAMTVIAKKSADSEEDLAKIHCFARVEGDTVKVGYTVDPGTDGVGVSFATKPVAMKKTDLTTSAGNIRTTGMGGDLVLRTSAGNIGADGADGCVDAKSSAGNIEVSGSLRGACRVASSAGNVAVSLPAASRLKIDAHTSAGNAKSEFTVAAASSYASASIVGVLGDGSDGTLEMKSSAGNLKLKKLP